MAAADRNNNTEQLQRCINDLWQHQPKKECCGFTLITNDTSIDCHKLVLTSASSYFNQLLFDSEHKTNSIDVTPLPEHILRTVVAFMYNSEYVIDDENVIELLELSRTWNLDTLSQLCVTYMNDNITINNACRFYNFALDNADHHKSQILNRFIRENFTSLYESGQLSKLSLQNFTAIIKHDEINVENEDVIFHSAVQIINQQTSVEDINCCLKLIRFPHTSGYFLEKIIRTHPLMKDPPRDRYRNEAILYHINKKFVEEVKPPRYWGRGIHYIGEDHCMYQYVSNNGNNKCVKMMNLPEWVGTCSSVASHRERVVIVGRAHGGGDQRALLLDMIDNTKVTHLPDLPEPHYNTGLVLSDNYVYVIGGYNYNLGRLSSVYYLSFGSDAWQTKTSMPHAVSLPLVIQHQQRIYVLGGNTYSSSLSSVSQYNIKDDTWKSCSEMPVATNSEKAGVIVHKNRINVLTVDKCLMYADDTDTWTVKQYDKLGNKVKAFVSRGQICAAVQNDGTFSIMSYDDVDNVWKTKYEKIDKAWETRFFS